MQRGQIFQQTFAFFLIHPSIYPRLCLFRKGFLFQKLLKTSHTFLSYHICKSDGGSYTRAQTGRFYSHFLYSDILCSLSGIIPFPLPQITEQFIKSLCRSEKKKKKITHEINYIVFKLFILYIYIYIYSDSVDSKSLYFKALQKSGLLIFVEQKSHKS